MNEKYRWNKKLFHWKKKSKWIIYIEHLLILISTVSRCLSISNFASLVGSPMVITCSGIGLKSCVINPGIKKYKTIKKKHDKLVLLAKSKLNRIEVLISNFLINSNFGHDEFVLINNVLKEFYDMKEGIKNTNDKFKWSV